MYPIDNNRENGTRTVKKNVLRLKKNSALVITVRSLMVTRNTQNVVRGTLHCLQNTTVFDSTASL